MTTRMPYTAKPFASSILLWMRTDRPRQQGMDYWKGPHSGIISATPGFDEYRQIHLAEANPGRWPATAGVETAIPADRRIDGVAEVTFRSVLSPLRGRTQTRLAFKDEINVFRRSLLYAGLRFHASLVAGFADDSARAAFFASRDTERLSRKLAVVASAVHAYDVAAALTYVKDGVILPHYRE
jgi:hypothetical protein